MGAAGTPRVPVPSGTDPPGPLVTMCLGRRCAGLHGLRGSAGLEAVRASIRRTPGGVLVSAGCLGPCHLGSFVVVGWRHHPGRLPLAAMDDVERLTALGEWLPGNGPQASFATGAALPGLLHAAADQALGRQRPRT